MSTPERWRPGDGTVVLAHGLCGCEASGYMVRLSRALYRRGVRSVRMNARGHGPGEDIACGIHHAGRSEDQRAVLTWLRELGEPDRCALVGFSLGGNVALKLASEMGDEGPKWLEAVVAVGAPVDLDASARRLAQSSNRVYEGHFLRRLRVLVEKRQLRCGLGAVEFPRRMGLRQFDDLFTSRQSGFESVDDYYAHCSAREKVSDIRVPTWILFAEDDPFVAPCVFESRQLPSNVTVTRIHRGGHLGFLGRPGGGGWRWMDCAVLEHLGARGFGRVDHIKPQ